MHRFYALFLVIAGCLLTLIFTHQSVLAYSSSDILNYCYPNAQYSSNQSCDASGIQAGASCAEDVGCVNGACPVKTVTECGCFGQNLSHTYSITHHATQCNNGQGDIIQAETFSCGQDMGVIAGSCGNRPTCTFMQDCEAYPGDGPHSGTQSVTGLLNSQGFCALDPSVDPKPGICIPKVSSQVIPEDANAAYDPQIVSQGEPVNVYVSATRPCASAGGTPTFDQGASLLGDGPNGACKLIQPMTCDIPNPTGDWRKCWAEYQCKAADKVGTFTATYSNDVAACKNVDDYVINKPKDCANQTRTGPTNNNYRVSAPTFSDDLSNDGLVARGTQPVTLNDQITTDATAKDTTDFGADKSKTNCDGDKTRCVGVAEGFLGQFNSFKCELTSKIAPVRFVLNLIGAAPYCPQLVNTAKGNTNLLHDQAKAVALGEIPAGALPDPAKADCVLQDVPQQDGATVSTIGNQMLNTTDSSLMGTYRADTPRMTPQQIDTTTSPVIIGGKTLDDQRPGEVDQNGCPVYQGGNFPGPVNTICIDPSKQITK